MYRYLLPLLAAFIFVSWRVGGLTEPAPVSVPPPPEDTTAVFATAATCMSCHNGIVTPSGEDLSFGSDWRASMMANSARDPYWQAAVRREVTDHPNAKADIEDECSTCHMPMARYLSKEDGQKGEIFAHLALAGAATPAVQLALDGVSCTTCHQITDAHFGEPASFTGGFTISTLRTQGAPHIFGPFVVDTGRTALMHSAAQFRPAQATHLQQSELCATCHTLYTHALGPDGEVVGELPEQVPYLEWKHSAYRDERSCQSCHMPVVEEPVPIASVLGPPREGVNRHVFRGGNFFMLRMLNRYRTELGVEALPQELDVSAVRTVEHLQSDAARVTIENVRVTGDRLRADVAVANLAGHKLPTAYPSRRVWLHVTVRDGSGEAVFESGALDPAGWIAGNDNDADPDRYEPHYTTITAPDQVQIYEAIMADPSGAVTTGLLRAVRFAKDNRVLPRGFDKATAEEDIAVQGAAAADADFAGGSDRVRYSVDVAGREGPFRVEAALRYQPIAYRWALNLDPYDTPETDRFVRFYTAMSDESAVTLASAEAAAQR
jgi:hypothetical protein